MSDDDVTTDPPAPPADEAPTDPEATSEGAPVEEGPIPIARVLAYLTSTEGAGEPLFAYGILVAEAIALGMPLAHYPIEWPARLEEGLELPALAVFEATRTTDDPPTDKSPERPIRGSWRTLTQAELDALQAGEGNVLERFGPSSV